MKIIKMPLKSPKINITIELKSILIDLEIERTSPKKVSDWNSTWDWLLENWKNISDLETIFDCGTLGFQSLSNKTHRNL